jgi:hypothetical protein
MAPLNLDRDFYVFILAGRLEPQFHESFLHEATREAAIRTIVQGQFDGEDRAVAVIRFNPSEGHSSDVSEDIAREVAERAMYLGEPPCHEARLYCERYGYEFRDRVQEAAE